MASPLVSIGAIRTSFGVKGWMKLSSHSGEWRHFHVLKQIFLENPLNHRRREYFVEGFQIHHGGGILKVAGINNPEEAKSLSQFEIFVEQEYAAALKKDEWYLKDLIGLHCVDKDGGIIGVVDKIIESSDDILEIRRADGSIFLVPFRKEFVGEPNISEHSILLTALWLMETE